MVHVHLTGWMPIVLALAASAPGQHHHGGASFASQVTPGHMHHGGGGPILVGHGHPGVGGAGTAIAIVGGYGGFGYYGLGTPYYYPTPLVINGPVIFPPVFPAFAGGLGGQGGGLMLPMPPADRLAMAPARPRRPNPERARELVEIGDRSFRGGNIHRAEERFSLAAKADPAKPAKKVAAKTAKTAKSAARSAVKPGSDPVTAGADGDDDSVEDVEDVEVAERADRSVDQVLGAFPVGDVVGIGDRLAFEAV